MDGLWFLQTWKGVEEALEEVVEALEEVRLQVEDLGELFVEEVKDHVFVQLEEEFVSAG